MKLSLKFFCIAYIIVLLSSSICGIFIINKSTNEMWSSQAQRVKSACIYAADSFTSLAELSTDEAIKKNLHSSSRQIKEILDSCISDISITSISDSNDEFSYLKAGEGFSDFSVNNDKITMRAVLRLNIASSSYVISVSSDFSEIKAYRSHLWQEYSVIFLLLSVISGIILYIIACKITKPINQLRKLAKNISQGNYGETADIKTSHSGEIKALSDAFNQMSLKVKEELNKRDTFVADFTHELKTPMTSIMGFSELLRSYELNEEERKNAADSIYKEARRLENLSREMLSLYIYKNEEAELKSASLKEIEASLIEALSPISQKYKIEAKISLSDVKVLINKELIVSLLYNLCENAMKASKENSVIEVYCAEAENAVIVFVKDYGIGISEENIKLIEDPFFRVDKARSRKQGGAGLGLSICKEIAKLHGSVLVIKSELSKGTEISFKIKKEENNE